MATGPSRAAMEVDIVIVMSTAIVLPTKRPTAQEVKNNIICIFFIYKQLKL